MQNQSITSGLHSTLRWWGPHTHSALVGLCVYDPHLGPWRRIGLLRFVVTSTGTGDRDPLTSPLHPCTGLQAAVDSHDCRPPDVKILSGEMWWKRRPPCLTLSQFLWVKQGTMSDHSADRTAFTQSLPPALHLAFEDVGSITHTL